MRKAIVLFAVLALALVGLGAIAGADSGDRPFKASFDGEVYWVLDEGCLSVNPMGLRTMSAAPGKASHLGKTTMTSGHCTPGEEDTVYGPGAMTFVAANDDELYLDYGGVCPLARDLVVGEPFSCTVEAEITGGTGRFEDASGWLEGAVVVDFLGFGEPSMPASWIYSGRIGY